MGAESRLTELGLRLPEGGPPAGNYVDAVRSGSLLFLSGHGPSGPDGVLVRGKVGRDLDVDAGHEAARLVGLNLLSTIRRELGTLDDVERIVKVLGVVNCAPGFNQTPAVIDGCSDLLVAVFGETIGKHARSAVGMAELPFDIAVEIELVAQVR
ncbi:MAG TPA: RidA family protein [Acidimicrobiales bacterium]|jgi:enamine deaminase RidA (YjgF/YER057c/UK114 family)|nr:RidA family protein [Acidimicrobiales bacterium]